MATKSKKQKKQEQERKERLKAGGQSIAKIAQQEVAKRQQKSFDNQTKSAGINKQYSQNDSIARNTVREIQSRQAKSFNNYLNDLFKAEQEKKQQEAIRKQNQKVVDSVVRWSMPGAEKMAQQAHNDLVLGGQKKRQTETEKKLTETAAKTAKKAAGTVNSDGKLNPVDTSKIRTAGEIAAKTGKKQNQIDIKTVAGKNASGSAGAAVGLSGTKTEAVKPATTIKTNSGTKFDFGSMLTKDKTAKTPYASGDQITGRYIAEQQKRLKEYQDYYNRLDTAGKYDLLKDDEKSSLWKGPVNGDALTKLMSQQNAKDNKPFSKNMDTLYGEKKQYKSELDELNARIRKEQDRLSALQPKTNAEKMAESEEWNRLNAYQAKISELSDHGLDITPNRALEIQGRDRIKKKPEDYYDSFGNETDRSVYYDAALYDAVHGEGTYEKIFNNGTDEEFDKVNKEVEDLWKRLEEGTLMDLTRNVAKAMNEITAQWQGTSTELQTAEALARETQKRLNEATSEIEKQRDYYSYMLQFQNPEKAGYIPENDRGGTAYGNMTELEKGVQTNDIHRIYSFITGGKEYQTWLKNSGWTAETAPITSEYSKTALMTPQEKGAFTDLYNNQKYDEAKAFLEGLQPYLNDRYAPYESIYVQEGSKQFPISASVVSQGMKIASTYMDIPRHIAGLLGDKSVEDRNSNWYLTSRQSEEIENTIANEIGGAGGKTYLNFMNNASNVLRGLSVPAESRLAQSVLGLGGFFLQVDQEATARYLKNHEYEDAKKLGAIDAAFELAEEFLPFETMLGTEGKSLGVSLLLNSLSEAGQEGVGATLFEKIKGIITGEDSEQARTDEILYQGYYTDRNGKEVKLSEDPDVALQQARTQAAKEFWQTAAENTAAGFFGGAFSGTYGTIAQAKGMSRTGKAISSERNNLQGKTGLDRILELGAGMKEGTASREIAKNLQARLKDGKKVSNFQMGKLAQAIAEDTGEQQGAVIKDTVQRVIRDQLQAKGVGRMEAGTYADIIATSMVENKGKLNNAARSVLAQDQRAIDVWKSYNSAGSAEEMATSLKNQTELAKEVAKGTAPQRSIMNTLQNLATDRSIVTSAMSAEVQRAVSSTKSDAEAIDYLAKNNSSLMSEEYAEEAKKLLESDPQERQTKSFVDDVMKIRMAAMSLMKTAPATNLSEETAQDLFEKAKKEFENTDKLRIQRTTALEPGKGVATFNGAEYGTDAWKEKTKHFSETVRIQMGAVSLIAKQFGHTVNFINDENRNMVNGWQSEADGSITINVATGMKHSMLATVTHEMTHWLEHNSSEGYAQLRQFIVDNLRANGKNVEQMLMDTIRNQERVRQDEISRLGKSDISSLTISDAMAELVAKSSEDILTSRAMKEAIAKADPNLYTKVKTFVRDVIARIDNALGATEQFGTSLEAYALRNVRDQIAGLWLSAREDALGNGGEAALAQTDSKVKQMSVEQLNKDYKTAAESGDTETAQKLADEAARRNGYTIKAYHGSDADERFTVFKPGVRGEMWFASTEGTAYERKNMYNTYLKMSNPFEVTYYIGADSKFDPTYVTEAGRSNGHDGAIVHFMLDPEYVGKSLPVLSDFAKTLPATDKFGDNFTYMPHGKDRENLAKPGELMIDFMKRGASEPLYDWYCVYRPEQIKSADPVTYDDDGNVIPLSERFNKKKGDIRYSVEENTQDRIKRMQAENKAIRTVADELINQNDTYSPNMIRNIFKGRMTKTFEQWLHNRFPNESKNKIRYGDVIDFIREDNKEIENESKKLIENWNRIKNKQATVYDITNTEATNGNVAKSKKAVMDYLFKDVKRISVKNKDTNTDITANETLIQETYGNNKFGSTNVIEKVLKNTKKLLTEATYIGSHKNYASNTGRVHYYVTPVTVNNKDRIVMYAVHDAVEKNGKRRAYVAEILMANENGTFSTTWAQNELTQELHQHGSHKVSIGELIDNVNDGRFRSFEADKLGNKKLSMSVKQMDAEYADAVESGNVQEQQELTDEAARRNGYTMKVYHGTPTGGFTQFKDWSYFTEKKEYADRYNHPSQSSTRGYAVNASQPMTYELYLNPGRVFDTRDPETAELYNQIRMEYGMGELTDNGLPDWTDGRDIIEYIEENDLPYDTIILNEGADGGYGAPVVSRGESYVTRSNMVKSADPVTYDDNGKVIPPSERFNNKKSDIRWSVEDNTEQVGRDLMAVHNLTYYDLMNTLKEGGFTAPSIAIIRSAMGHNKYGEISVLFKKSSFDPRSNKKNKIYGADAYTPTRANAHVETELKYEDLRKIAHKISKNVEGMEDQHAYNEIERWFNERSYREVTTQTPKEMAEEAWTNDAFLTAYLTLKGKEIPIKTRERYANPDIKEDRLEAYQRIFNAIYDSGRFEEFWQDVENKASGATMLEKWADIAASAEPQMKRVLDLYREKGGILARNSTYNWIKQTIDWLRGGSEKVTETDWYETRKAMWDMVKKDEFVDWLAQELEPAFGRKGIRNNLNPYTPYGNSRSWSQLHKPYTIENVVRAMYENAQAKGQGGRYATGVMATASKEYRNLEEVRADKERLRMETEADYEQIIEELNKKISELGQEILESQPELFDYALMEAGRYYAKSQTIDAIRRGLAKEEVTATNEQLQKIKDILDEARNVPTGYFESKPERVMNFDEIDTVLLPENTYHELLDKLDELGIYYEFYDGTEEDRTEKMNSHDSLKFSVEQAPDMDVQRFMLGLNEFHMNTEQERVMLKQFKELKGSIDMIRFGISEREKQIREIEGKKETSVYDREKLRGLKNIQQNEENRLARMEKEMIRVTSGEGYAKLMYKSARMMSDLVTGRSAEDMQQTVRTMNSELENVTKEMAERAERLKALAEKEAVLRIRQQFDRKGLKRIAAALKKNTGSSINNETIENRLALIALKMKQGQFDQENTQELAELITGGIKTGYDSYIIDALRGSTITLSPAQMKELKGQNRTLADVRRELAGTGIRIGTKGSVSLDAKWDELCDMIPSLNRDENALNMLDSLLGIIRSEKNATYTGYGTDENLMAVSTQVLEAARDLIPEIVTDEKSLKLIKETLEFVKTMSAEARGAATAMEDVGNLISNLKKKSADATGAAEKLTGDVKDAIEYFNELSKQSEAAIWKRERAKLIEQLKSENTQNILMEQEKWKQRIERDKTARKMQESNLQLRKRISTNYGRIRKLILAETDQRNVPEHMKSLARFMLEQITNNDLVNRKLTGFDRKDLAETARVLDILKRQDGDFSLDDLRMIDDEEAQAAVAQALADLQDGIGFYNATPGKDLIANLQAYRNSLERISEAVTTITNVINAERSLSFWNRKMDVADAAQILQADMKRSRFKGEMKGFGSKAIRTAKNAVGYGNTTPVYFFKNLRNRGMDMQWEEMEHGENRNGIEMQKAKDRIGALAEKTGYKDWAGQKHKITLGGFAREISIENMMELYAIWKREQTTNPEMSQHLAKGGVYIQEGEEQGGKLRREKQEQRAIRVTDEEIQAMYDKMTDAQKEYLDGMVSYLSNEMSELGNEASMRMYGIRKYKESYYFPMKVWDGVKSARSDKGITGTDENRAAHKSWSKRRQHMASNALVIGNFTEDAVKHIVEMINYNTMAPAIENINKILNYQFTEGGTADDMTKRNMRVMFQEAYGKDALVYLETLMKDLNGGTVQDQRKTLRDRMLSVFKKNAVAGSLSVALQQPLSYIRAAMMISPKYLAQAISPNYWKGSYAEMMKHSGVGVIKSMGRFDMNFGQSAKDYITPETGKNLYGKVSDALTVAPELMDRMTWTRMWTACKLEQKAQHPEMDVNSDAFLDLVGERFNEVMRRTQVYDSVLVKSSNMRSQNLGMKVLTSFMAEPTLSLNVLADAVRNAGEKGGMATLGKAGATFMLSAVCQALVKGAMGSGRTPDEKKTWMENFLYKWYTAFLSEADPLGLVPGFSDMVELIKNGKLQDDAMSALGKVVSVIDRIGQITEGKGKGIYRDIEDTAGQIAQLFTNVPAKNLMRDARAMYNWITQEPYAKRDTSSAVLKYQTEAAFWGADTLIGALNSKLGDAGFKASNTEYYSRIYNAMKNGNDQEAEDLREYLTMMSKAEDPEKQINSGIKAAAKADDELSEAEKSSWMIDNGMMDKLSDVTGQYRDGKLNRQETTKLMKQMDPEITDNEIWWKLDQIDYRNETGAEKTPTGYNYRLKDAINANKADEIKAATDAMLKHGITKEKIKKDYLSDWKSEYLEADADGKRKIRDALEKAYKAIGYTAADADKVIDGWMKEKKKKTN